MLGMWLRWSWRDLRARWIQVLTIALVIALGTGSYAGLSSVTVWRVESAERSFEAANLYDLRARLPAGSFVAQGSLVAALDKLADRTLVQAADERLLVPTQLDASTADETILVTGRIVGLDLSGDGPEVNLVLPLLGRGLTAEDSGRDVVLLERNFADHYGLPAEGDLLLAGDRAVRYVGHGTTPEFFNVVTEGGGFLAQASFAGVFTSLETAQRLAGRPDSVNDLVLTLTPEADRDAVATELRTLLRDVGVTIMTPEDDASYRIVTEDPEGDQQFYNVFAVAIFGGAVFAAFNLTTRMVEAQRREIGIAMAIGIPARTIAVRPFLFGLQIALLGVVFGIGVGILIAQLMRGLLQEVQPSFPVFETPFQFQLFAVVAVIGLVVPLIAITYPVLRAVRVNPVDAIKPSHLNARGNPLVALLRRAPLPGDTFAQLPFRNLLRSPRRALLTILGVAAVLSVLVGIVGILDSLFRTIDRSDAELLARAPNRIEVALDGYYPVDSPQASAVFASPTLAAAEPVLQVPALLLAPASEDGDNIDLFVTFVDLRSELWRPTVLDGDAGSASPGIVLSEGAAADLGVVPGDTVRVRHPRASGPTSFELVESDLPVLGVHPHPFRFVSYIDIAHAGLLGLDGAVNRIYARPALGEDESTVQRALFGSAGVASIQGVTATTDAIRDAMAEFTGVFQVIEGAALLLAVLIAFNAASISEDERARENATMLAFGIPVRTVLRMSVVESLAIGLIGTVLGLGGGYLLLRWTVEVLLPQTLPDIAMESTLSLTSLAVVLALGILAVAAAPLFTYRKLRRMNIPSTLRVME
jgi:putative ABC transport system permease protein